MLRRANGLMGIKLHALDGELGHVDDFYFDDLKWTVRYMIVRTGSWFNEKRVMLSPSAIRDVVWDERAVYVDLTKDQIRHSPDLDMEKPVTREQEMELARHFEWPTYWLGSPAGAVASPTADMGLAGTAIPAVGVNAMGVYPVDPTPDASRLSEHITNDIYNTGISETAREYRDVANSPESKVEAAVERAANAAGLHHELHGVKAVTGYHIAASDGEIGHVSDFFIDEDGWHIQYMLVDTSNWLPGRHVLIATDWISEIMWEDSRVHVKATRDQIQRSPKYDPHDTIDRAYEGELYEHYGYPPYWM